MLSNYGYEDGTGVYYLQIDTRKCETCEDKPCINACPGGLFEIILDDFDEEIIVVKESVRNQLKDLCSGCPDGALPCRNTCPEDAVRLTWKA